jgi:putative peptide zinc metalloprotease protein
MGGWVAREQPTLSPFQPTGSQVVSEQSAFHGDAVQPVRTNGFGERPALGENVRLVGELQEAGFDERQWLLQRDGQFVQVTELLYRIAEQMDGARTLEDIAARVSESSDWIVNAPQVRQLLQTNFVPLGLLAGQERSSTSELDQSRSPLRVSMRMRMLSPRFIEPITQVLQVFYRPWVMLPMLMMIMVAHVWLYVRHGVDARLLDVFGRPADLLAATGVMVLAGIFHEFGHASALRYGGGRVRGMGAGFYLIYPAFFTDVTDSYRLGRWARVRTDLGGFYFYLVFALGLIALYRLTGQEFLLLVVLLINFDIVYQLLPFVRLDGYWAFADLTGIPDPLSQMGPFLRSMGRGRAGPGPRLPKLKHWVKVAFVIYTALTIPVLSLLLFLMITRLPMVLGKLWASMQEKAAVLSSAQTHGDLLVMVATALQMLVVGLLALGIIYVVYNLARRPLVAAWKWFRPAHGQPAKAW